MPNKRLTIIQVLPALNGGGVEKGTLEIGRYLADHGHRSIVVSAGGRMVDQLIAEGSEHIQADIGAKKPTTLRYIPWFRRLLLDIRPDIIHFRSRLPAWIGYLAWKSLPEQSSPRWVTTFHGQHSVNRYSAIMASGERVITVSNFMRDYILKSYPEVDPNNISVIHRGVDTAFYFPGYRPDSTWIDSWHREYPQTRGKLLLTLSGRLTRRKGIEDFLEILASLIQSDPAIHGLIVGEASADKSAYLAELKRSIATKNLGNHVTFTGHRSDLRNIMAISKVVLSLSKEPEAFGRTVTEALSLGIPVIGYDHGGVSEQLETLFPEGRVAVSDYRQAARTIHDLLNKIEVIIKPNEVFTLEKMCKDTLALYQDLTLNRPDRSADNI